MARHHPKEIREAAKRARGAGNTFMQLHRSHPRHHLRQLPAVRNLDVRSTGRQRLAFLRANGRHHLRHLPHLR